MIDIFRLFFEISESFENLDNILLDCDRENKI